MTVVKLIGGEMHAEIPSPSGGTQSILIPMTLDGVRILKRILSAQPHHAHGKKLGTESEPTQALINEWLKAERQRNLAKEVEKIEDLELEIEL